VTELFPARDWQSLVEDVLHLDTLLAAPRYAHHDRDTVRQVFDLARTLAQDVLLPLAAPADREEPRLEGGRVILPDAVGRAVEAVREAGFLAGPFDTADGGLQLPVLVTEAVLAILSAASAPLVTLPGLTMAAAGLLRAHGSPELVARYLPDMLEGRVFGTMALSEPHAGSSLADLTTTATPAADGTYRVVGN
jgi:alkylation response protein AidB-like acyl-CoA dehydrogenase